MKQKKSKFCRATNISIGLKSFSQIISSSLFPRNEFVLNLYYFYYYSLSHSYGSSKNSLFLTRFLLFKLLATGLVGLLSVSFQDGLVGGLGLNKHAGFELVSWVQVNHHLNSNTYVCKCRIQRKELVLLTKVKNKTAKKISLKRVDLKTMSPWPNIIIGETLFAGES